jgi:hypothetical protein
MAWVFLWLGLAIASQIWLSIRVSRSSVALAVPTLIVGFPAAIYTLLKQRGDPATTVTAAFVANLVFSVLASVSAAQTLVPMLEAQQAAAFGLPVAAVPAPTPALQSASAPQAPGSAEASAAAAETAPAAPPTDPVDGFSAALKAAGLNHTVTRMAAAAALPEGVVDAALFSVAPMGLAVSSVASAASAANGSETSATLFKCESASACRNLAGAYMQQSGPEKRRVLQNGLLILLMPPAAASDTDLTPTAVASVFRRLS